jgi:hypothetical protein
MPFLSMRFRGAILTPQRSLQFAEENGGSFVKTPG